MAIAALKQITLQLPSTLAEMISSRDIIVFLLDKALGKREYYRTKCRAMEEKYQTDFESYKRSVEEAQQEHFAEWDDLMLWEGYELARQEWNRKFEDLRQCIT